MTHFSPSKPKQRIEVIDALRGFALLGILFANILSWSGIKFLPFDEIKQWPNLDVDLFVYRLVGIFVDTKFYTIFSILFGIGFYLQFNKNRNNQRDFMKVYYRRLLFLMLFGLVHMFFWSGDILFIYGLVGFIFVQFRNLKPEKLLIIAIISFLLPIIYDIFMMYFLPGFMVPAKKLALHTYYDMSPEQITEPFKNGTFWEVTKANWHNVKWRYFDLLPAGRIFKILSFFILGFYMMSKDYFTKKATSVKLMTLYFVIGLTLTLIAKQVKGSMGQFPSDWNDILYKILFSFGQVNMALSYISFLTIIYKYDVIKKMLEGLKYAGRMSFSTYLGQTLIGIIIFYPYCCGLYGRLSLWQVELLAIGIYTLQVWFARIWLKHFMFGPLEWLWRSLTYNEFLSMRREKNNN